MISPPVIYLMIVTLISSLRAFVSYAVKQSGAAARYHDLRQVSHRIWVFAYLLLLYIFASDLSSEMIFVIIELFR